MNDAAYLPGIPAVLAIDPGIETGWAVLDRETQAVLGTGVLMPDDVKAGLDTVIRGMHRAGYALSVVVEEMPHTGRLSTLSSRLEQVRRTISSVMETFDFDVRHVLPGTWKPSRVARRAKLPQEFGGKFLLTHQRDAIRLALYVIDKENPVGKGWAGIKRPPFSAEHRERLAATRRGRVMSTEIRVKISVSLRARDIRQRCLLCQEQPKEVRKLCAECYYGVLERQGGGCAICGGQPGLVFVSTWITIIATAVDDRRARPVFAGCLWTMQSSPWRL